MFSLRLAVVTLALAAPQLSDQEYDWRSAWKVLREAHDANGDGKIEAGEYTRSKEAFRRLDADGDGILTDGDMSSPQRDVRTMDSMMGDVVAWLADQNKDDRVAPDEWRATLDKLDPDGDGIVNREGFSKIGLEGPMLEGLLYILDRNQDGKLQVAELEALFSQLDKNGDRALNGEEIANWRSSHLKAGDAAPLFELPRAGRPNETVRLADFRGKRPVALIFGSYT